MAKKNPQDTTLRNTRSANDKLKKLKGTVKFLREAVRMLTKRVAKLEGK